MKKLFAVLFCSLVMAGAAFADELSYEIDPVATAKAPWKVGDVIIKTGNCRNIEYFRKFLGVTQSGFALVQDFYPNGEMRTSPFLTILAKAGNNTKESCWEGVEGNYTFWHKNGQKWGESNYKNGGQEGLVISWYENGQKSAELYAKSGEKEGLETIWYEEGQKWQESNFRNGKKEGRATIWYKNGQKQQEGNYKNNNMVGMWRAWNERGDLIREDDFGGAKN